MNSEGLTLENTGGLPYGGIKIGEVPFFHQFRKYYRSTYPEKGYSGDLSFNFFMYRLYEKYYKRGNHIYISSVYNYLERTNMRWGLDLLLYYRGYNRDAVESPKGERKRKIVFFKQLKKIWKNNSKIPITDFELNEFVSKKLAIDKNFNLEDYLKHINSKSIPQNNLNRQNFDETMSHNKILIPNSGLTMEKVRYFEYYKSYYKHYHNTNYPGDYSFNTYLINFLKSDKKHNYNNFKGYIKRGDVVPHIDPIKHGDAGTITNSKGVKVFKIPYFDELKIIWNRYVHINPLTDFELNEFLIKKLRNNQDFNLEKYLEEELESWKIFKLHFPNAEMKEFKGEHYGNDYNIYYRDTPIEILGNHPAEKFNQQIMKSLGLSPSFPMSLQLIPSKFYPIRGFNYNQKTPRILNEFEITVSDSQSFHAKFRDIFRETTIHFHSKTQCSNWLASSNFNYWPQQLNFIVYCATSGCGISLNEKYPKRIQEFINFHIYFTIRRLLWEVKIPLPGDSFFNQTSNHFNKIAYRRLCQEFNIDENSDFRFLGGKNGGLGTIFVNGKIPPISAGLVDWSKDPSFNGDGFDNGIIINLLNDGRQYDWFTPEKGKGLTKAGLGRLNRSVEAFVYCIVGAEVDMRSSIVDIGEGQNVQEKMIKLFEKAVIEEDLAKSVQRYQLVIQEAKLKLNFAFAPNIWLFPSNMIINTESVIGYNNFLVKAKSGMVFGENKLLNNQLKNVGIAHNLGQHKTILPHIVEKKHSLLNKKTVPVGMDDSSQFVNISSKPQTSYSSHDLNKTIVIIIAGIMSYMIFR